MRGNESTASIVIVEAGAQWPRFAQRLQRHAMHAVVESQPVTESVEDFRARVVRRVEKLGGSGIALQYAVMATNERMDPSAVRSRERLARSLASVIAIDGGALIFSASEDVADSVRHHLFTLAGSLMDELAGAPIEISVRFVSASSTGVRVVRPSDPDLTAETA